MRVALAHGNLRAEARAALPGEVPARAFGIRRRRIPIPAAATEDRPEQAEACLDLRRHTYVTPMADARQREHPAPTRSCSSRRRRRRPLRRQGAEAEHAPSAQGPARAARPARPQTWLAHAWLVRPPAERLALTRLAVREGG
jgi:hypothetical protein